MPSSKSRPQRSARRSPAPRAVGRIFRPNGISFLLIPSEDPKRSAQFYGGVFGWKTSPRDASYAFEDSTGDVVGHWVTEIAVAGDTGVRFYIYVENVDDTLRAIARAGGTVVRPPYPEGNLRVATFRDPSGNVVGIWQQETP
jgi:uncharacterized protein